MSTSKKTFLVRCRLNIRIVSEAAVMDLSRHNENIKEGSLSSMLMAGLITKKKIHLVRFRVLEKLYVLK